jgi:hypothetical protein
MTEIATGCGWCRDPYCTGDHSADEAQDFGGDASTEGKMGA